MRMPAEALQRKPTVTQLAAIASPTATALYFRVPLEEALDRILSGRPELKYYEAGMDLGLSIDPYKSFEVFQGRILDNYEKMVPEFGLSVIDATQPIAKQQAMVRKLIEPHLTNVIKMPIIPHAEVLSKERLSGRYLDEVEVELPDSY